MEKPVMLSHYEACTLLDLVQDHWEKLSDAMEGESLAYLRKDYGKLIRKLERAKSETSEYDGT
jgi:hypothetical protein